VFIFAQAAQGPKMPLAIVRKQVKDLPYPFSLDDSMAMSPAMKISSFPDVVVAARVSKSGNAMPQAGDLEGTSKPVKLGASGLAVVIDSTRP
jgi:cytochrome c-type biogenesis protein CcmH